MESFTYLDSSTELGEGVGALLLGIGRDLTVRRGLGLLAESEGESRLALVGLQGLLLLAVDSGRSGLGGLSGSGSGRGRDLSAQGLGSLRLGNDRSGLWWCERAWVSLQAP